MSSTPSLSVPNTIAPSSNSEELPPTKITWPVEEETFPNYQAEAYFPAQIGQVLQDRYRIIGKLGYGINSTVWLAWDERLRCYAALKIYKRGPKDTNEVNRELNIYKHIAAVESSHPGKRSVRSVLDSFQVPGPNGEHWCLVHEPLWESCERVQQMTVPGKLTKQFLRDSLKDIFLALDYLHAECNVIHADIKGSNILMKVEDQTIFAAFEEAEEKDPTPFKVDGDRRVYLSRDLEIPDDIVCPVLTDFGNAYIDSPQNKEDCQPWQYRAPEVILRMPWSYENDIWNMGVLIWNLFENKTMFSGLDPQTGKLSHRAHLAEMVGYLGEPPLDFLKRSDCYSVWFDDLGGIGMFREDYKIPNLSMRRSEENLIGRDKDMFLDFMSKMLKWVPEQRATAEELLEDPWLNGEPSD